jgi:tRNA A37 threonylcarbamoyladenosine dehydratase
MASDYQQRFGGIGRLYSAPAQERIRHARVCVIGIGGVGSWAAEALARSGVGALTLVDLDDVCVSNVNRQLHALDGQIGHPKAAVMAKRVAAIHPECRVEVEATFYSDATSDRILGDLGHAPKFDCVLDAIDNGKIKCHLINACRDRGLPVVLVGGAGGRKDPSAVTYSDLSRTYNDPLLHQVRRQLRRIYHFPSGKRKLGIDCVFSTEPPVFPWSDGSVCGHREKAGDEADLRLNCESGFGTASFVTGTFGFLAAARVIEHLVNPPAHEAPRTSDENSPPPSS